jgi:uncharacterized SAM-binding protein YcdF (DUF218 family)
LSEQERLTPDSTIYEPGKPQTSNSMTSSVALPRIASGMVVGAAIWMIIKTLGVPNVFHILGFGGIIPFAIAGAFLGLTKCQRVMSYAAALILIALLVIAYTPLIVSPARNLIRRDALPTSANAVVVLSAGVTADGFLHQQGLDRLLKGLQLVRAGVSPVLVVTREQREVHDRKVTAVRDQDSLAALAGVTNVVATPLEASTHDEAIAVALIAKKSGWTRIVLVTSPFHSRRACATFEKAGLAVSCAPSDSRDVAVGTMDTADDRVGAFGMWIYEMAATLQYRRKGWL